MNMYALTKLISSVEFVDARKRLQKAVFLLQQAGCDLGAEYFLHFYGPYSRDVAEATDQLAAEGILLETPQTQAYGSPQYSYSVTPRGREVLGNYERSPEGAEAVKGIRPHLERFQRLNGVPLWTLELAATIVFYHSQGELEWEDAEKKTAEFKQVAPNASVLREASELARQFA